MLKNLSNFIKFLVLCIFISHANAQWDEIRNLLSQCHRNDKNFDNCMKRVLNQLRPYFKGGIPEIGIPSFDPHFATLVEQRRGVPNANYYLRLTDVYELGWTISKITKFKTDWDNNRIIYTQYFPEKTLLGDYNLKADALGTTLSRSGNWNLTLYDYAQTTTITRGEPGPDGSRAIDVKVVIDKIGNMQIHVSNILNGINLLENILDSIINAAWRPGFVFIKPLINDLVSTAFTKIWGDAFKDFPLENIIPE